jgi:hypothetical protein
VLKSRYLPRCDIDHHYYVENDIDHVGNNDIGDNE